MGNGFDKGWEAVGGVGKDGCAVARWRSWHMSMDSDL